MFFIDFERGRIFESAMDKLKVKYNAKVRLKYFSVNILPEIVCFFMFNGEIQQLV